MKPDIISLTETWIPYANLDGYNFILNCRQIHIGGGVAILLFAFKTVSLMICSDHFERKDL